jgi:hypothetical protein
VRNQGRLVPCAWQTFRISSMILLIDSSAFWQATGKCGLSVLLEGQNTVCLVQLRRVHGPGSLREIVRFVDQKDVRFCAEIKKAVQINPRIECIVVITDDAIDP